MTEREALLAAILDAPTDDTRRLIYADHLEEYGDEEDRVRAEFVRVQVELAREPAVRPAVTADNWDAEDARARRWSALCRRERELLGSRRWHRWLELPALVPDQFVLWQHDGQYTISTPVVAIRFRRGFVGEIRLPLDAWLQHGPALLQEHPVERVELSDREPTASTVGGYLFLYAPRLSPFPDRPERLPGELIRYLWDGSGATGYSKIYLSHDEARAALSAACLLWAREKTPE